MEKMIPKFKAKRKDNGLWARGSYFTLHHNDNRDHIHHFIIPDGVPIPKDIPIGSVQVEINPDTLMLVNDNGEELLVIERSEIINRYKGILAQQDPKNFGYSDYLQGQKELLESLFASKCVPDQPISKTETPTPIPPNSGELKSETAENEKKPTENMEEKELNLCELLKDCIYETFYSPICGECEYKECFEDSEKMLFEAVKEDVDGGYASLVFDAEGRYEYHGICMLFPSKELYKKYPLDPRKAWMEWSESRKPQYRLSEVNYIYKGEEIVDKIVLPDFHFDSLEETQEAVNEIKALLEAFHKRKEGEQ